MAGATGAAGAAGTMGAAGAGGAGGTGAAGTGGVVRSAGCGKMTTESSTAWNKHTTMVTIPAKYSTAAYGTRIYWTRPPTNYDPMKAYNLFIWGQGCGLGTNPDNPIPPTENPLVTASSIVVELDPSQMNPTGKSQCFSAGPDGDNTDSPELPYFDNILSEVESEFCIDKSHVYQGGYSSGGWFSALMSCVKTNLLAGTGWVAAGLQKNHDTCMGAIPAIIIRATMDNGTPLDQTMQAVENLRMRNGCGTTTKAWNPVWNAGEPMADTSSCQIYDGCMANAPLVFCQPPGGHTNTDGQNDSHLTRLGTWKLWGEPTVH
jgi:hypothetical protein